MSGVERAAVVAIVLMLGLDAWSRWTGQTFALDLLGPNQLGAAINAAGGGTAGTAPPLTAAQSAASSATAAQMTHVASLVQGHP